MMPAGQTFVLNEGELQSPPVQKLARAMEARLMALRAANDMNHTAEETAQLRGEIAAVKHLLHSIFRRNLSENPMHPIRNPLDLFRPPKTGP